MDKSLIEATEVLKKDLTTLISKRESIINSGNNKELLDNTRIVKDTMYLIDSFTPKLSDNEIVNELAKNIEVKSELAKELKTLMTYMTLENFFDVIDSICLENRDATVELLEDIREEIFHMSQDN